MVNRYFPFLALLLMALACSKDKVETKPSIRIKNINTTEVFPGQNLVITLEFSDKEGDLSNGEITYIRERLNIRPIPNPAANDKVDTVRSVIPEFPNTAVGEIDLTISSGFLSEDPDDNDTMVFKIFVTDVAGNRSDTLTTPTIVDRQN